MKIILNVCNLFKFSEPNIWTIIVTWLCISTKQEWGSETGVYELCRGFFTCFRPNPYIVDSCMSIQYIIIVFILQFRKQYINCCWLWFCFLFDLNIGKKNTLKRIHILRTKCITQLSKISEQIDPIVNIFVWVWT